jgi:hypothetical protein
MSEFSKKNEHDELPDEEYLLRLMDRRELPKPREALRESLLIAARRAQGADNIPHDSKSVSTESHHRSHILTLQFGAGALAAAAAVWLILAMSWQSSPSALRKHIPTPTPVIEQQSDVVRDVADVQLLQSLDAELASLSRRVERPFAASPVTRYKPSRFASFSSSTSLGSQPLPAMQSASRLKSRLLNEL